MRKNIIAGSIGLGLLALSSVANADSSLTFNEMQGSSFVQWLTVTPSGDNTTVFQVSGLDAQFDSLSFSFVDLAGLTKSATVLYGVRRAVFNDASNNVFSNTYSLMANTPYQVKISGQTRAGLIGGEGTVSVNAINAVVTMVPEPESYAMLLAGLGLLGVIARRRASAGSKCPSFRA